MEAKNKSNLIYQPAPERLEWFDRRFNDIVPPAPCGGDARYLRYVWGMDRMERRGKTERRRYPDFNGKYVGKPRFILEGWQSPDVYDRAEWERNSDVLGAFPINGVWDFIETHETDEEEFLPLDESALERARSWAFWRSKGFKRSVEALLEHQAFREKLELERRREAADKVLDEFVEDAVKADANDRKNKEFSLPSAAPPKGFRKSAGGILIPN